MVDIVAFVVENAEIILSLITILSIMVARYFKNYAGQANDALVALNDFIASFTKAVADGTISQDELVELAQKFEKVRTEIGELIEAIQKPDENVIAQFVSLVRGYSTRRQSALQGIWSKVSETSKFSM